MTDKERQELAEAIGKGLAYGTKISAEDLQNENTNTYKMGEIMEMDADFVTLLNFVDWYSPTREVNDKLTKMLRHIGSQTYQNQTKIEDAKALIRALRLIIEDVCDVNFLSKTCKETLTKADRFLKG